MLLPGYKGQDGLELLPGWQWRSPAQPSTVQKASTSPAIPGLLSKPDRPGFGVLELCQTPGQQGKGIPHQDAMPRTARAAHLLFQAPKT